MPFASDHLADTNRAEFTRLAHDYFGVFPDFVKQADIEDAFTKKALSAHLYADPVRRQFPCNTAVNTYLSALYYQEKSAEFHPKERTRIEGRLASYATSWNIKAACDALRKRWEELHKTANDKLPDSAFAYVWAGEGSEKVRRMRVTNPMEVKAAAEYLMHYRDRFSFQERHAVAKRILEKAARFGAGIAPQREFLEKQAGMGVCEPAEVVALIEERIGLIKSAELKGHFRNMATAIRTTPGRYLQPSCLVKLAETVDQLDRDLGLVSRYEHGLNRPEDVIFKATFTKAANEIDAQVALTSGKVYEKNAFTQLRVDDVSALFGTEFAEAVSRDGKIDPEKMAEEARTLPRAYCEQLEGLLAESGVTPILHKAASARQGLDRKAFEALAAQYTADLSRSA